MTTACPFSERASPMTVPVDTVSRARDNKVPFPDLSATGESRLSRRP